MYVTIILTFVMTGLAIFFFFFWKFQFFRSAVNVIQQIKKVWPK